MSEPTIEQLMNFARVRITTAMGIAPSEWALREMFDHHPTVVEEWRAQHAAFQRAADELAALACEWCHGAGFIPIDGADGVDERCLRCDGTGEKR